jgi:hypothetical protein
LLKASGLMAGPAAGTGVIGVFIVPVDRQRRQPARCLGAAQCDVLQATPLGMDNPAPLVVLIHAGAVPRWRRQGRAGVAQHLLGGLSQADLGAPRVVGAAVHREHVLPGPDDVPVRLRGEAPLLFQPGLERVFF